jgi:hypothetical protein
VARLALSFRSDHGTQLLLSMGVGVQATRGYQARRHCTRYRYGRKVSQLFRIFCSSFLAIGEFVGGGLVAVILILAGQTKHSATALQERGNQLQLT